MTKPNCRKGGFLALLALFVFSIAFQAAEGQHPTVPALCGEAKVTLGNPVYLTTSLGMVTLEPPQGWALDKARENPFYLLKSGEKYESARTLIYINIERLEVPFQRAIQSDARAFSESCQPSRIQDVDQPEILEQGCERKAQMFFCERKQGAYVDLATKISVEGLLLNIVLSADSTAEISRYRKDYDYLLKHLALVSR
jgi:hypothetical protein